MASGDEWDAEKMLQLYVHDYMVKKNMHRTAEIFAREANVCNNPVVIDVPEGFLSEWWSIFYDLYASRQGNHHETGEQSSVKDAHMTETKPQSSNPLAQQLEMNQKRMGQFPTSTDHDKMLGQPAACMMATQMYEEEHLRQNSRNFDPNVHLLDVDKMNISKSAANIASASSSQLQISRPIQQQGVRDIRLGSNLGRAMPGDPTIYGIPKAMLPSAGPCDAVINHGVNPVPLRGWPLTGIDQIPQGLGHQVLSSFLQMPNQQQQFQMSSAHQQKLLAQLLAQTPANPVSSYPGTSIDKDTQSMMFPLCDSYVQDGQMFARMKQTAEHQQHQHQLLGQLLQEGGKKRKSPLHSQPGDYNMDRKDAGKGKLAEENIESFLFHDDAVANNTSIPFGISQQHFATCNNGECKELTFEEAGCFNSSRSKVLCCHFSSNGKLLASAGHDRVMIWNMETFDHVNTTEGHGHLITDVRFRQNSTVFATSSFDRTVQIWDAGRPSSALFKLLGHTEQVMSLDFHPNKVDLLCSCDSNAEIRLWNVNNCACTRVTKGANRQVRFQPLVGKLLAAASESGISVIDVETDCLQSFLKGHAKEVRSICWDASGNYIASVSEDSARVWSATMGGKCIHELHSNGSMFESCAFHPGYPLLLVIGGYQTLELWNPTESSRTMTVQAHNGIIAALSDSPQTRIIASASHDHSVKLWK
ncbi:transcriptional corepressor LEUNIG_HOMOLOG-like [Malania oleifera]|uniref:transcriptional corepressor LEUNIG_HOMOLOG-like n=1 Tax=Malania oleifera TaxID=397392 RepID=UPI0025AE2B30|nr:transcriptional corepressor LEUNIG_HOMOLOG-like [Malania oleifera]XP_057948631.1 transcriptional corepressor LEUNIG_HOMOLOG-like [Malania oleifera]